MSAVAPQVLHMDVCGVGLWGEAIVTHVDPGVGYSQAIHVETVEPISILGKSLAVVSQDRAQRDANFRLTERLLLTASM